MGPTGPSRVEAGKLRIASLTGRPPFEADDQLALIHLLLVGEKHAGGGRGLRGGAARGGEEVRGGRKVEGEADMVSHVRYFGT